MDYTRQNRGQGGEGGQRERGQRREGEQRREGGQRREGERREMGQRREGGAPAPRPTQQRPPQGGQPSPRPMQQRPPQGGQPSQRPMQQRPPQGGQPAQRPTQQRPPQGGQPSPRPMQQRPPQGGQPSQRPMQQRPPQGGAPAQRPTQPPRPRPTQGGGGGGYRRYCPKVFRRKLDENVDLWTLLVNVFYLSVVVVGILMLSHFGLLFITRSNLRREVPDLAGMPLKQAVKVAKRHRLKVEVGDSVYVVGEPKGVVLDQLPQAGISVKPGRKLHVVINAFGDRIVPIPYVAGLSLRQARNIIESSHLTIDRLEYKQDMATNYILEQRVGSEVVTADKSLTTKAGAGVTLIVGVDRYRQSAASVPNLVGKSLAAAKSTTWDSGFNMGRVYYVTRLTREQEASAVVVRQSLISGNRAPWGSGMDIWLDLPEDMQ